MTVTKQAVGTPYDWIKSWGAMWEDIPEDYGEEEMPVLKEPVIPTMNKKVIIEAAITGWQPVHWWRDRGVQDVFVMGLATDYCVKFTVLDACSLGFRTHMIEDGCRGVELAPGDVERAIADMRAAGAEVVRSDSLRPE